MSGWIDCTVTTQSYLGPWEDSDWLWVYQRVPKSSINGNYINQITTRFYNAATTGYAYVYIGLADHPTKNTSEYLTPEIQGRAYPGSERYTITLPTPLKKSDITTSYLYVIMKYYNMEKAGYPALGPIATLPPKTCTGNCAQFFTAQGQWYALPDNGSLDNAIHYQDCGDFTPPCPSGCYEWDDGTCHSSPQQGDLTCTTVTYDHTLYGCGSTQPPTKSTFSQSEEVGVWGRFDWPYHNFNGDVLSWEWWHNGELKWASSYTCGDFTGWFAYCLWWQLGIGGTGYIKWFLNDSFIGQTNTYTITGPSTNLAWQLPSGQTITEHDFGNMKVGDCTSDFTVLLSNLGPGHADGEIYLDYPQHFQITEGAGSFSLNAGSWKQVKAKFCPTAKGWKDANIIADCSTPGCSDLGLYLEGTGTAAIADIDCDNSTFYIEGIHLPWDYARIAVVRMKNIGLARGICNFDVYRNPGQPDEELIWFMHERNLGPGEYEDFNVEPLGLAEGTHLVGIRVWTDTVPAWGGPGCLLFKTSNG